MEFYFYHIFIAVALVITVLVPLICPRTICTGLFPPPYHFSLCRISHKPWDQLFVDRCIIHENHRLFHFNAGVWTKCEMQGQFFCWLDKEKSKHPKFHWANRNLWRKKWPISFACSSKVESLRQLDFGKDWHNSDREGTFQRMHLFLCFCLVSTLQLI